LAVSKGIKRNFPVIILKKNRKMPKAETIMIPRLKKLLKNWMSRDSKFREKRVKKTKGKKKKCVKNAKVAPVSSMPFIWKFRSATSWKGSWVTRMKRCL